MLEAKWTCDICGFEAVTPQAHPHNIPPRWGLLQVDKGGSSASRDQTKHLCPACVNRLDETDEKKK